MKKMCLLTIAFCMVLGAMGQGTVPQEIVPFNLQVTTHKTSSLVFPYGIRSVDRGSRDLLAQKAKGAENVLQLKAGRDGFPETNLSVITGDGKFYAFKIVYVAEPANLYWMFPREEVEGKGTVRLLDSMNEATLQFNCSWVDKQAAMFKRLSDRSFGIKLLLNGIYIDQDVLYYQLEVSNATNINYSVVVFRIFIKDRRQSKRTASQELVQEPLLIQGEALTITANSTQTIVVALPKFTIPDQKELILQFMEQRGGRHLELKIGNKTIVKAKGIPAH